MQFKDYYKVMGLTRDATEAQIKQAYRKLARKYHPDVSKEKDAEERFKELGEAYEVLRNPEKRAAYDQLGSGPRPGEDWRPPPDWGAGFEFSDAGAGPGGGDYSDFFETLFGATRAGRARRGAGDGRDADHHARVMLDLEAALEGGTRQITLRLPELDADGHLRVRERTLNVQVPKGILPGQTIRLAGQGAGRDGAATGDLYLEVDFQPHPFYRIEGRDLALDLPVAPWEAALGATVKCPTPGGAVDLKIPPGSRAEAQLRLKGRGMPARPPGDLYVRLKIVLPPEVNERAREAYRALAAAEPFNPRAALGV